MDCIDSCWNSGDPASAQNSLDDQKDINHASINEDFQCTFFRQPKPKHVTRNHTSQPSGDNSISFNLSDTCTDSESELDEPVNETQCLQTNPTNSSSPHAADDQISQLDERALHAPRVTFDRTLYIHSDRTVKSCLKKRPIKEAGNGTTNVVRLSKKRNYLGKRSDRTNKKCCVRFCATRFPRKYENQLALKEKILLEERTKNHRNTHADVKGVLRGTKRSYDPSSVTRDDESTCKRKKLIEDRIVKNKRLLKSMEEVIRSMGEKEGSFQLGLASVQSIKPLIKIAETDLTKLEEHEKQGQKPKKIANRRAAEKEIRKPVFKKPELEKLLDESMHEAVKRYRTCRSTWDDIKKEKFIKA